LNLIPIYEDLNKFLPNKKTNINSFTILHMIGQGGFSKVFLGNLYIF